jgi:2Fe-2S ferredoxin
MPIVKFIEHDGAQHQVEVPVGDSVMQGAVNHGISGIAADCGGGLACATCHCYVDEAWTDRAGAPSETERQMLDATASPRKPNSRLSCQITVTDELSGLVVRLPESQY